MWAMAGLKDVNSAHIQIAKPSFGFKCRVSYLQAMQGRHAAGQTRNPRETAMQVHHAKLAAHHVSAPFGVRLGGLALAIALVGGVLLEAARLAAGIVA
jgi:hypothetical protein